MKNIAKNIMKNIMKVQDDNLIKECNGYLDKHVGFPNNMSLAEKRSFMDIYTQDKIKNIKIKHEEINKHHVISPNEYNKVLVHIHGGGWVYDCFGWYIDFLQDVAIKTKSKIIYLYYPLAPENKGEDIIKFCADEINKLYDEELNKYNDVYLSGDSAGGYLALNLIDRFDFFKKLILFCPAVTKELNDKSTKLLSKEDMVYYFNSVADFNTIIPNTQKKIMLFLAENDVLYNGGEYLFINMKNITCYKYNEVFHNFMFTMDNSHCKDETINFINQYETINTFEYVLKFIVENSLIVLDIDDTIMTFDAIDDDWMREKFISFYNETGSVEMAKEKTIACWKEHMEVNMPRITDENGIKKIFEVAKKTNSCVKFLTARNNSLENLTKKQFNDLKIENSNNIHFTNEGSKGEYMKEKKILDTYSNIIFIDDNENNICGVKRIFEDKVKCFLYKNKN